MEFLRRRFPRVYQAVQDALEFFTNVTAQVFGAPANAPQPRNARTNAPIQTETGSSNSAALEEGSGEQVTTLTSASGPLATRIDSEDSPGAAPADLESQTQGTDLRHRKSSLGERLDLEHETIAEKDNRRHLHTTTGIEIITSGTERVTRIDVCQSMESRGTVSVLPPEPQEILQEDQKPIVCETKLTQYEGSESISGTKRASEDAVHNDGLHTEEPISVSFQPNTSSIPSFEVAKQLVGLTGQEKLEEVGESKCHIKITTDSQEFTINVEKQPKLPVKSLASMAIMDEDVDNALGVTEVHKKLVTPTSETDNSPCDLGEDTRKTWEDLVETAVRLAKHCNTIQEEDQELEDLEDCVDILIESKEQEPKHKTKDLTFSEEPLGENKVLDFEEETEESLLIEESNYSVKERVDVSTEDDQAQIGATALKKEHDIGELPSDKLEEAHQSEEPKDQPRITKTKKSRRVHFSPSTEDLFKKSEIASRSKYEWSWQPSREPLRASELTEESGWHPVKEREGDYLEDTSCIQDGRPSTSDPSFEVEQSNIGRAVWYDDYQLNEDKDERCLSLVDMESFLSVIDSKINGRDDHLSSSEEQISNESEFTKNISETITIKQNESLEEGILEASDKTGNAKSKEDLFVQEEKAEEDFLKDETDHLDYTTSIIPSSDTLETLAEDLPKEITEQKQSDYVALDKIHGQGDPTDVVDSNKEPDTISTVEIPQSQSTIEPFDVGECTESKDQFSLLGTDETLLSKHSSSEVPAMILLETGHVLKCQKHEGFVNVQLQQPEDSDKKHNEEMHEAEQRKVDEMCTSIVENVIREALMSEECNKDPEEEAHFDVIESTTGKDIQLDEEQFVVKTESSLTEESGDNEGIKKIFSSDLFTTSTADIAFAKVNEEFNIPQTDLETYKEKEAHFKAGSESHYKTSTSVVEKGHGETGERQSDGFPCNNMRPETKILEDDHVFTISKEVEPLPEEQDSAEDQIRIKDNDSINASNIIEEEYAFERLHEEPDLSMYVEELEIDHPVEVAYQTQIDAGNGGLGEGFDPQNTVTASKMEPANIIESSTGKESQLGEEQVMVKTECSFVSENMDNTEEVSNSSSNDTFSIFTANEAKLEPVTTIKHKEEEDLESKRGELEQEHLVEVVYRTQTTRENGGLDEDFDQHGMATKSEGAASNIADMLGLSIKQENQLSEEQLTVEVNNFFQQNNAGELNHGSSHDALKALAEDSEEYTIKPELDNTEIYDEHHGEQDLTKNLGLETKEEHKTENQVEKGYQTHTDKDVGVLHGDLDQPEKFSESDIVPGLHSVDKTAVIESSIGQNIQFESSILSEIEYLNKNTEVIESVMAQDYQVDMEQLLDKNGACFKEHNKGNEGTKNNFLNNLTEDLGFPEVNEEFKLPQNDFKMHGEEHVLIKTTEYERKDQEIDHQADTEYSTEASMETGGYHENIHKPMKFTEFDSVEIGSTNAGVKESAWEQDIQFYEEQFVVKCESALMDNNDDNEGTKKDFSNDLTKDLGFTEDNEEMKLQQINLETSEEDQEELYLSKNIELKRKGQEIDQQAEVEYSREASLETGGYHEKLHEPMKVTEVDVVEVGSTNAGVIESTKRQDTKLDDKQSAVKTEGSLTEEIGDNEETKKLFLNDSFKTLTEDLGFTEGNVEFKLPQNYLETHEQDQVEHNLLQNKICKSKDQEIDKQTEVEYSTEASMETGGLHENVDEPMKVMEMDIFPEINSTNAGVIESTTERDIQLDEEQFVVKAESFLTEEIGDNEGIKIFSSDLFTTSTEDLGFTEVNEEFKLPQTDLETYEEEHDEHNYLKNIEYKRKDHEIDQQAKVEYSTEASIKNGGLYENLHEPMMVTEIDIVPEISSTHAGVIESITGQDIQIDEEHLVVKTEGSCTEDIGDNDYKTSSENVGFTDGNMGFIPPQIDLETLEVNQEEHNLLKNIESEGALTDNSSNEAFNILNEIFFTEIHVEGELENHKQTEEIDPKPGVKDNGGFDEELVHPAKSDFLPEMESVDTDHTAYGDSYLRGASQFDKTNEEESNLLSEIQSRISPSLLDQSGGTIPEEMNIDLDVQHSVIPDGVKQLSHQVLDESMGKESGQDIGSIYYAVAETSVADDDVGKVFQAQKEIDLLSEIQGLLTTDHTMHRFPKQESSTESVDISLLTEHCEKKSNEQSDSKSLTLEVDTVTDVQLSATKETVIAVLDKAEHGNTELSIGLVGLPIIQKTYHEGSSEEGKDQTQPQADEKTFPDEPTVQEDDDLDSSMLSHGTLDVSAQKSRVHLRRKISIRRRQRPLTVTSELEADEPQQPAVKPLSMGVPMFSGKIPVFPPAAAPAPASSHPAADKAKEERTASEDLAIKPKKGLLKHAGFGIPHPQMMQELQARLNKKKPKE